MSGFLNSIGIARANDFGLSIVNGIRFPDLEVQVGGQTGLDISPLGRNKGQIIRDFGKDDFIYFYGDMMAEGQNDFPLANIIKTKKLGFTYHVHSYEHTWHIFNLHIPDETR